MQLSWT